MPFSLSLAGLRVSLGNAACMRDKSVEQIPLHFGKLTDMVVLPRPRKEAKLSSLLLIPFHVCRQHGNSQSHMGKNAGERAMGSGSLGCLPTHPGLVESGTAAGAAAGVWPETCPPLGRVVSAVTTRTPVEGKSERRHFLGR